MNSEAISIATHSAIDITALQAATGSLLECAAVTVICSAGSVAVAQNLTIVPAED